jgi:hypothetical protein
MQLLTELYVGNGTDIGMEGMGPELSLSETIGVRGTVQRLKSTIFWDITPCSPFSVNRRFGGNIAFFFRVEKISPARNRTVG